MFLQEVIVFRVAFDGWYLKYTCSPRVPNKISSLNLSNLYISWNNNNIENNANNYNAVVIKVTTNGTVV